MLGSQPPSCPWAPPPPDGSRSGKNQNVHTRLRGTTSQSWRGGSCHHWRKNSSGVTKGAKPGDCGKRKECGQEWGARTGEKPASPRWQAGPRARMRADCWTRLSHHGPVYVAGWILTERGMFLLGSLGAGYMAHRHLDVETINDIFSLWK